MSQANTPGSVTTPRVHNAAALAPQVPEGAQLPPVPPEFDWEQFRKNGKEVIDFIADYHQSLQNQRLSVQADQKKEGGGSAVPAIPVKSAVQPGFLTNTHALGQHPPETGAPWGDVMSAVKDHVMPGVTHWQHPNFFAYFPAMASPSALLGNLISDAVNQPGFTWAACPSATEVELVVMDWLVEALQLPKDVFAWGGTGGGVLQPSATEGMMVAMLAAKTRALNTEEAEGRPNAINRLCCYFSDQSHFCVEKAAKVLGVAHVRKLPATFHKDLDNYALMADDLEKAVREDKAKGLVPFFVSGNFGATGTCSIDPLPKFAQIARYYGLWFNVDAAYAGSAGLCPEYRPMMDGVELADSILINGSKWMSVLFNTAFMFFRDKSAIVPSLNATGVYLTSDAASQPSQDLKDYQFGLGRPFRSLKVYTAIKHMGLEGIRASIRRHTMLAQRVDRAMRASGVFDVITKTVFGLVVFRIRGATDDVQMKFLQTVNNDLGFLIVHTNVMGAVALRFAIAGHSVDERDVDLAVEAMLALARKMTQGNLPSST